MKLRWILVLTCVVVTGLLLAVCTTIGCSAKKAPVLLDQEVQVEKTEIRGSKWVKYKIWQRKSSQEGAIYDIKKTKREWFPAPDCSFRNEKWDYKYYPGSGLYPSEWLVTHTFEVTCRNWTRTRAQK